MKAPKGIYYAIALATSISVIAIILSFFRCDKAIINEPSVEQIKRDTVFVEVPSQPIVLENIKTKIVERWDTIIQVKPFYARIDTVVQRDTIYAEFAFPENEISLLVRRKPDSIEVRKITILKTIEKQRLWWEVPALLLGGATFGFLLGSVSD